MRNYSFEKCYFRVMNRTRAFLMLGLLCSVAFAQNLEFVHYLQASQNPEYPYSIYVWNPGKQPLEISTKHKLSKLTPLTPELGRETLASIHFAPDVASTLVLPANQNYNNIPLNFRLETNVPIGVYNLALEFPGWKPDTHPIALNTTLKYSTIPRLGNRYLYVGNLSDQYLIGQQALSPKQLNGAIFTLMGLDANKAVFAVENLNQNVTLEFQFGKPFPGLALIVPDLALESLTRKYLGKTVWRFGGFELDCFPMPKAQVQYSGTLDSQARVKRIFRLLLPSELRLAGGYSGGAFDWSGDFIASTPIAIQFDQTHGLTPTFGSSEGLSSTENAQLLNNPSCRQFTELNADAWQLERLLSLNPASSRVPRNPRSLIGLDRWQVAWLWGFPSVDFGTRAELMKRPVWQYANIPFPAQVTFKNDKVIEVEIPRLP